MLGLLLKAFSGLLTLFIALGLMIFLIAGTLYDLKGWIYLLTFVISVLPIVVYLIKKDPKL